MNQRQHSATPVAASTFLIGMYAVLLASEAQAQADPDAPLPAFAAYCFSPFLTAAKAAEAFADPAIRHDFYDLNPFSDVAPSPGADVTPGTDRRCAVAFDGDRGIDAIHAVAEALKAEGLTTPAPLPATHIGTALPGTTLMAAVALNPGRVAVVHTGTRPGPNGTETFLSVERLTPEASAEALR